MWHSGHEIARVQLPARAPVRRVGIVHARQGPRAALARTLLVEAQAVFSEASRRQRRELAASDAATARPAATGSPGAVRTRRRT